MDISDYIVHSRRTSHHRSQAVRAHHAVYLADEWPPSSAVCWQSNVLGQKITVLKLPPPGQRCGTVCLNSFGNRTSPSDNSNDRWKRLCLVSLAVAPCVWTLRALTRNLLTYLLTYLLTCFLAVRCIRLLSFLGLNLCHNFWRWGQSGRDCS